MEDEDDAPLMELVPPGTLRPEEEKQFLEECAKVDNALSVVSDFLYNHGREWKVDSKPARLFEKVALQAVYFREVGMMDEEFTREVILAVDVCQARLQHEFDTVAERDAAYEEAMTNTTPPGSPMRGASSSSREVPATPRRQKTFPQGITKGGVPPKPAFGFAATPEDVLVADRGVSTGMPGQNYAGIRARQTFLETDVLMRRQDGAATLAQEKREHFVRFIGHSVDWATIGTCMLGAAAISAGVLTGPQLLAAQVTATAAQGLARHTFSSEEEDEDAGGSQRRKRKKKEVPEKVKNTLRASAGATAVTVGELGLLRSTVTNVAAWVPRFGGAVSEQDARQTGQGLVKAASWLTQGQSDPQTYVFDVAKWAGKTQNGLITGMFNFVADHPIAVVGLTALGLSAAVLSYDYDAIQYEPARVEAWLNKNDERNARAWAASYKNSMKSLAITHPSALTVADKAALIVKKEEKVKLLAKVDGALAQRLAPSPRGAKTVQKVDRFIVKMWTLRGEILGTFESAPAEDDPTNVIRRVDVNVAAGVVEEVFERMQAMRLPR